MSVTEEDFWLPSDEDDITANYTFPELVITDDRQSLVASLMPEIDRRRHFDPEEALRALVSALKKDEQGMKLIEHIDGLPADEKNEMDLKCFKNVLLRWGYPKEKCTEDKCKAVELFHEIPYVRTKQETMDALKEVRKNQILSTFNPFDLWACMLCSGFMRKLKDRDTLFHLSVEEDDDVYDLPDLIDTVLDEIDWDEYTYQLDDPDIPDQDDPDPDTNEDGSKKKERHVTPFTAEEDYICPICWEDMSYYMGPRHMFICSRCQKACHYRCIGEWVMTSMSVRDDHWKCPTCNSHHRF